MVAAGTLGYTLGAIGGWAIGRYGGRPYLDRHGRWLHLGPNGSRGPNGGSTAGATPPR